MVRKKFYEVDSSTYLFPAMTSQVPKRNALEEPVRQWCAFELIRGYGITIGNMEFERKVRVGSKTYEIDILIYCDGQPWVVVECKEPKHNKHEAAMDQAKSYAGAQEIQAEYAVYTNGNVWNVQRLFKNRWITVPDLPGPVFEHGEMPMFSLLMAIHEVAPLLYKLDEPLDGKEARTFFCCMQNFFHGWNVLTEGGDLNLQSATDNLLRVLSSDRQSVHYMYDKLEVARQCFERFRELAGFPYAIYPVDGNSSFAFELNEIYTNLVQMVEATQGLATYESLLLRLNVAILEYARAWGEEKTGYPLIGANLHHALRALLTFTISFRLRASLPDTIDKISNSDVRSYCAFAWKQKIEEVLG